MAKKKVELFDYQKDLLRQLKESGLKVTVTVEPIGTDKSTIEKKLRLLELARSGAKKPSKKENVGLALKRYCSKSSYDADFDRKIRGLRPDWFVPTGMRIMTTKEELLKLAESGAARPRSNIWAKYQKNSLPSNTVEEAEHAEDVYDAAISEQRLGRALINYTNKTRKTYDAEFDAKIRALRPDWFN